MGIIWVAISALAGGLVASILGWLDSGEPFDERKFAGSAVRALVAAVIFAVAYNFTGPLSPVDIGIAFIGGAGVDSIGNRVAGAIKAGLR